MDFLSKVKTLRAGEKVDFPPTARTLHYAKSLDDEDEISHLRDQFILPTKASLKKKSLDGTIPDAHGE
jgi:kynureninase